MKKVLLEIGKAVLAIVSLVVTLIFFGVLEEITGIFVDELVILKILVQFICFGTSAFVLCKTRACVLTAIIFGILFCEIFLCVADTGLSPIVAMILLGQVIPIYVQEKKANELKGANDEQAE